MRWRLALLLASLAAPAAAQGPWPAEYTNPRPMPDDLVLPMPCGGSMVFRPVATPAGNGALEDRSVTLGQPDASNGAVEFARRGAVAGPFTDRSGVPLFWMGKYEVTRDQVAAVLTDRCPRPSAEGRLPMADINWFVAVACAGRYTIFLMRNARNRLPSADGSPGFVRLPTEAEWEYAARGGAAVSELDFLARTFPMPEGINRYAWFQGPRSANNRAQAIGQLEPNPLGLFDVLGNVGEMVLDPFQAVRVGRLQGQPGGVIVKGGDFRTPEQALRTSMRIEMPPFDNETGGPTRLATVGFRVMIGGMVTTSLRRAEAMNRAFEEESRASGRQAQEARAALEALRRDADPRLAERLNRLEAALMEQERARTEQERAGLRAQFEGAAVLARTAFMTQRRMTSLQESADTAALVQAGPEIRANWVRAIESARAERELAIDGYARIVADLGRSAEPAALEAEARVVANEADTRNTPELRPYLEAAARHAAAARNNALPSRDRLREDIMEAGRRAPAQMQAATVPTAPAATQPAQPPRPTQRPLNPFATTPAPVPDAELPLPPAPAPPPPSANAPPATPVPTPQPPPLVPPRHGSPGATVQAGPRYAPEPPSSGGGLPPGYSVKPPAPQLEPPGSAPLAPKPRWLR